MDKIHRKTLLKLRAELKKNLEVDNLWDELTARAVFSEEMVEEFKSHTSPGKQRDELLANLPKRGPRAFELFLECLDETDQSHIKEVILRKEAELRGTPIAPIPKDEDVTDLTITSGVLNFQVTSSSREFLDTLDKNVVHYRMSSHPRGYALLINNRNFVWNSERIGTDVDGANLENLLKQMGYIVEQHRNVKAQEIKEKVRLFTMNPRLNHIDTCIFAIMSHGENGEVYGSDDMTVPLDSLINLFEGDLCPALKNKPKVFIIQACRGKKKDTGFDATDGPVASPDTEAEDLEKTITQFQKMSLQDAQILEQKLPSLSDTLIAYSTIPGYVSWRNTETGSWFIQCLCQIFAEFAHKEDALSLLTMVNNKMSTSFGTSFKQTPAPVFTLKKKLYFFPGV